VANAGVKIPVMLCSLLLTAYLLHHGEAVRSLGVRVPVRCHVHSQAQPGFYV
jgi:hypothetical protein